MKYSSHTVLDTDNAFSALSLRLFDEDITETGQKTAQKKGDKPLTDIGEDAQDQILADDEMKNID